MKTNLLALNVIVGPGDFVNLKNLLVIVMQKMLSIAS